MGAKTEIEWTDATWNPVRGCSRVSEGCRNCYAERVAARFSKPGQAYEGLAELRIVGQGTPNVRREPHWTGTVELANGHLEDPLNWRKPRRIFVNSMSDLFHPEVHDDWIDFIFGVMALAKEHTFQVLTKRPERMLEWATKRAFETKPSVRCVSNLHIVHAAAKSLTAVCDEDFKIHSLWPLPNVWLGVSVENQKTADERIPLLLQTPAAVRFLSCEPLLAPIATKDYLLDTSRHNASEEAGSCRICGVIHTHLSQGIDWVIAGGESGPGARPAHPDWFRSLRDQCRVAEVPFFFKQHGAWIEVPAADRPGDMDFYDTSKRFRPVALRNVGKKAAGSLLDGVEYKQFPEAR